MCIRDSINTDNFLKDRLSRSIAIQGTQKLHGFIPIPSSTSKVKVNVFSESDISTTEKVTTIQAVSYTHLDVYKRQVKGTVYKNVL